ncbi:MAG: glycosyltransferase family 4 protein [Acidobacteriota bacterium]
MRILNLVAGQKWTGTAAVVFDQTAALIAAGIEAQFGFVGQSPLAERLGALGWARPVLLPPRGPLDYARDVRRLASTIERERFDIVHTHATHDHHVAAWAIRGTRTRLVRTIHNVRHVRRDFANRHLFRRTVAFAFANSEIARAFGSRGPVHSPVIDTSVFHPAESTRAARMATGLPQDRILVGTVGKLADGRGHWEAIGAAAGIPDVTLVHVGHGEFQPFLQALTIKLLAFDRNLWLGYQEERLPDLYRAWDAFLFPASGSEQGQRAILEAMASGLPVVALDVPGVSDLMTDGREGLIARTADDLEPALRRLAADPSLRREMGRRARERALAFTGERFAEEARIFYAALERRGEGAADPRAPALA